MQKIKMIPKVMIEMVRRFLQICKIGIIIISMQNKVGRNHIVRNMPKGSMSAKEALLFKTTSDKTIVTNVMIHKVICGTNIVFAFRIISFGPPTFPRFIHSPDIKKNRACGMLG